MKSFFILTASLIILNFLQTEIKGRGDIVVTVTNLENEQGQVRAVLFQGEEGFPDKNEKAHSNISVKAESPKTIFTFKDVPYGEYAISLLHDKNENGEMDTNIFGYPQEGYGISNNKTSGLSMPEYKDAHLEHAAPRTAVLIHLRN